MLNNKCVFVIDQNLPLGLIANTAGVLALSIGEAFPGIIGRALEDSQGVFHRGITMLPIPILKGTADSLKEMREAVKAHEPELTVVGFTNVAQTAKHYEDYSEKLESYAPEQIEYLGLALFGPKKVVNKFTGNLGLLR
ncbi:hypothetical protein ADIMK_3082 [Marinobacterium lacunae]|uniref:DUF2000 domain-containing protein n=1 Tax=Marinobacterium lacunae TaxID=1232683 RepID=A0A081FVQ5_9GAMM|nr:DUF2000 domain-containing protein [Marinobacterium lacunae]KEA62610.1 hypothetical protein ADIMK_3082 [Marinobacterium lacunae]MBR9882885.1 DUF2000 domain-containing protein [Oceanospirillales bacterium]